MEGLPPPPSAEEVVALIEAAPVSVAIIGRPNVGKSSLLNALVGKERSIVSSMAGTTRDAIDTDFVAPDGRAFKLVDTAGVRKRTAIADSKDGAEVRCALRPPLLLLPLLRCLGTQGQPPALSHTLSSQHQPQHLTADFHPQPNPRHTHTHITHTQHTRSLSLPAQHLSVERAFRAVRRCDVAVLVIDAAQGITQQDFRLAEYVAAEGRACCVVVNKWDLLPDKNDTSVVDYEANARAEVREGGGTCGALRGGRGQGPFARRLASIAAGLYLPASAVPSAAHPHDPPPPPSPALRPPRPRSCARWSGPTWSLSRPRRGSA